MWLKLYTLCTWIFSPAIDFYLKRRLKKGKEDEARFGERLGYASLEKPKGYLIWIHAASVGEAMSVLPLIHRLHDSFPDLQLLFTTGTVTSASMLETRMPSNTRHQYIPVDKPQCVSRFLRHWKPDLTLWVESELWPNMITATYKTGCPLILLNGRMSKTSYRKWRRYPELAKAMLRCFSLCIAQTSDDKKRLRQLGAQQVDFLGNLKFDALPLPADPAETGRLVQMIGERPVWMATSTHEGEEESVIDIHNNLKQDHPNLLTIIAPRHPKRAADIVSLVRKASLVPALRSEKQSIKETTDIYIADTIGELGIFYRLVTTVFMGGSLISHGGQNPLEPARLECAIITGPHIHNFANMYNELVDEKAALICSNSKDLETQLEMLLFNYEKREEMATQARSLMQSKTGVLDAYISTILPFIKPLVSLGIARENT